MLTLHLAPASYGQTSPPGVASLSFNPGYIFSGSPCTGTVTLTGPAPTGGATVTLKSGGTGAMVPTSVYIAPGAVSATFPVTTQVAVFGANYNYQINASYNGTVLDAILTVTSTTRPYGGLPVAVSASAPARIEAENYDLGGEGVGYHDIANGGDTAYRSDNIGVEAGNVSNGYYVTWTAAGEWDTYTLSIATAGTYTLSAALSSTTAGGTFHLEFGPLRQVGGAGVTKTAEFTVPNTGGFSTFQTVSMPGVALPAGLVWMRLVIDSQYPCRFDDFTIAGTPVQAGQVRYFPRPGYESRMVGGQFQGSPDNATWQTLYTVTTAPSDVYTTAAFTTDPKTLRFLRYLSPSNGECDVAEIEFDSGTGSSAVKITGTGFGTPGSYNNSGNDFIKALDANTATFFDSQYASGSFVGIDQGGAPVLTSIVVSPNPVTLNTGASQPFTAVANDQNGKPLSPQPPIAWTSTGVGTITSAGLYSAGATAGTATVTAKSGTVSGMASVTVNSTPPVVTDLSAYATGSGKITLYWTALNGASGYNVYRGTTTGGEDYAHPVNGTLPVNAASYSGSAVDTYSNTGLVNGTQYFYTVKAVYGSTQSQASNEDSDVPDPAAVPWDTRNPGAIISAFGNAFSSDTSSIGADPFSLRVVGPDNTIYDPSFSTAQPPDGSVTPGTNQFVGSDGSTQALPDDEGELDPASQSTSSSQPNAVGTALQGDKGPFRRVSTHRNADGSGDYRGATGTFYLPGATVSPTARTDHGDTPVIYLGISGSSIEVDAGLALQPSGSWALEMQVAGKQVSAQPGKPGTTIQPTLLENIPGKPNSQYQRFAPGSLVIMSYWAWGTYPVTGRAKLSLLLVDDPYDNPDNPTAAALGAPAKYLNREENVRVKRVHAVAQTSDQKGPIVYATGTTVGAASWSQGSVFLPGAAGASQGWSSADGTSLGEDGYYEGGNSQVDAQRTSPYIQEDDITITINPVKPN